MYINYSNWININDPPKRKQHTLSFTGEFYQVFKEEIMPNSL